LSELSAGRGCHRVAAQCGEVAVLGAGDALGHRVGFLADFAVE
jgi:hypothetical protein